MFLQLISNVVNVEKRDGFMPYQDVCHVSMVFIHIKDVFLKIFSCSLRVFVIERSYESRYYKIKGVNWKPIYEIWSKLGNESRQVVDSPGQRQMECSMQTKLLLAIDKRHVTPLHKSGYGQ